MGYKSRDRYTIKMCLKECENRGGKCKDCFKFRYFKKKEGEDEV